MNTDTKLKNTEQFDLTISAQMKVLFDGMQDRELDHWKVSLDPQNKDLTVKELAAHQQYNIYQAQHNQLLELRSILDKSAHIFSYKSKH